MNPWWLLLIVPASAVAGVLAFIGWLEIFVVTDQCDCRHCTAQCECRHCRGLYGRFAAFEDEGK